MPMAIASRTITGLWTMRCSSGREAGFARTAARIRLPLARCALLYVLATPAARAQSDSALLLVLQRAHRIRVEFADQRRVDGTFQQLTPTQLRFRAIVRPTVQSAYFADLEVLRDSITRIWVRAGSHWKTGAIVGATALGASGFYLGMKFKDDTDTPDCSNQPVKCVAGTTLVGVLAGGIAGGLFGAVLERWSLVWPP
jgi:hypothetical protein